MDYLKVIEDKFIKKDRGSFKVGDVVRVHQRVVEEGRSRVQIFEGLVIARKGSGLRESFCVRRVSSGEGVERVFPLHSPAVVRIVVSSPGTARRAKLYDTRKQVARSR